MKKRILSLMMAALLILSVFPLNIAFAAAIGDVDGNGKITAADARLALRASVGLETLTAEQIKVADVDGKPGVTAADARLVLRASVGLETLHTHKYTDAITTAPTCTEKGVKTFTCECGDTYTEEVAAKGHTEVADKEKAPTCTATGLAGGTHCSVCNAVIKKAQVVPVNAHTEVADKNVAATCTTTGLTGGTHCSVCGTVVKKAQVVPAKGHTEVIDKAVAATCKNTGKTEGKHCSVCNTVLVAQQTVPVKAHTEVADKEVAATCTNTGLTGGIHCSACGDVIKKAQIVPAKGHTVVIDKAVAATCKNTGKTEGKHCSVCNIVLVAQETVPVSAVHAQSILDESTVVAVTCKADGYTGDEKCTLCGTVTKKGSVIKSEGIEHSIINNYEVHASCSQDGYTVDKCENCDYFDSETVKETGEKATGHTWSTPKEIAPTCTEQGYTLRVCSDCESDEKTNFTDAAGHKYTWKTTKKASCKESGERTGTCSICGDISTETIGLQPCTPAKTAVKVRGNGDTSCKEVIKCTVCSKTITEAETDNAHRTIQSNSIEPYCTTPGEQDLACQDCNYTKHVIHADALGHDTNTTNRVAPTCTVPGYIEQSGKCNRCGETFEGVRIPLKATGHSTIGTQTCTTSEICTVCTEVIAPSLGHNYAMTTEAYNAEIHTFFCSRCNTVAESKADRLDTFNNITNKIITVPFYNNYHETGKKNRLVYIDKSSATTTYSRFDFGIYTPAIRSLYEDEMGATPDSYSRVMNSYMTVQLPLASANKQAISLLKEDDIDNITVERLPSLKVSDALSDFATKYTVGSREYDIADYKNVTVNESVVKVTIDIKNEKFSTVKSFPENEFTALQKISNVDIRENIEGFEETPSGDFVMTEIDKGDGYEISMTMKLRDIYSDSKVVYYFRESTYEPIIALYYTDITMEQAINMKFKIGITINGALDPILTTSSVRAYMFPNFFELYK